MGKQTIRLPAQLLTYGQMALHLTQLELAELLGSSRRTTQRWFNKQSVPTADQLALLARHVYPVDPELAAEIAAGAGATLESLGIIERSPTPSPPPPSPLPPRAAPEQLVENILYAAASVMDMSPRVILPAIRAAFARAKQLDMDVAAVDTVLTPAPARSSEPRKSEAKQRSLR
jgi:transcriptional regulator with XRE-family HTH domain